MIKYIVEEMEDGYWGVFESKTREMVGCHPLKNKALELSRELESLSNYRYNFGPSEF